MDTSSGVDADCQDMFVALRIKSIVLLFFFFHHNVLIHVFLIDPNFFYMTFEIMSEIKCFLGQ